MRHKVVKRVSLGLVLVLVAAALGFARHHAGAAPPVPAVPGAPAEPFARHCAACHDERDLAAELAARPERGAALLDLLEFLTTHGAGGPQEDLAVARRLLDLASAAGE